MIRKDSDTLSSRIMRCNNYVIVPQIAHKELSSSASLLLGYIISLSEKNKYCFANDRHLAREFNCNTRTIGNWLKELEKCGFIERKTTNINCISNRQIFLTAKLFNNNKKLYEKSADCNTDNLEVAFPHLFGNQQDSTMKNSASEKNNNSTNQEITFQSEGTNIQTYNNTDNDTDIEDNIDDDKNHQQTPSFTLNEIISTKDDEFNIKMINWWNVMCNKLGMRDKAEKYSGYEENDKLSLMEKLKSAKIEELSILIEKEFELSSYLRKNSSLQGLTRSKFLDKVLTGKYRDNDRANIPIEANEFIDEQGIIKEKQRKRNQILA